MGIVTGAARGQGRSHAVTLASEGANIVACDITSDIATIPYHLGSKEDLAETARLVEGTGQKCIPMIADVRQTTHVEGVVKTAADTFGRIDILVANAGICDVRPLESISDSQWDDMVDVNLSGVFKCIRGVFPHMKNQHYGRIVATSSMGGRMGNPGLAHYVSSKWGVIGLIKTAALEGAAHGINANAVCQPAVNTDMANAARDEIDNPNPLPEIPSVITTHRIDLPWVEPIDISRAILFLVTENSRYISGSTLDVCLGGSALIP